MEEHPAAAAAANEYSDDIDSCCSTPCRRDTHLAEYYYSAPASPTHFVISTTNLSPYPSAAPSEATSSFEFDFSATCTPSGGSSPEFMTCADELFCNGQIRPLKLSTHLRRPQSLAPLIESEDEAFPRGRGVSLRAVSMRRRTRSMSPLRLIEDEAAETTGSFRRQNEEILSAGSNLEEEEGPDETAPPYASRSSSAGRSSRRWVFLKELLYRSKSEGRRNEGHNGKFWGSLPFSPVKDSKNKTEESNCRSGAQGKTAAVNKSNNNNKKGATGKRRGVASPSPSAHELHYKKNRAQSEEMRKKTYLPYRQGLLGCLGFSSKSCGAINGFARALNPASSR